MKSNASGSVRYQMFKPKASRLRAASLRPIAHVFLVSLFFLTLLPGARAIDPNRAPAAPGDLVPTFGVGGVVKTDFAGGNDSANAIGVTRTGKIIAAGSAAVPGKGTDFALACYDNNGNLDQ